MTTKHLIRISIYKLLVASVIGLLFVALCFCMMGCANTQTSYREGFMPSGMAEDSQDYPTKYNMMDSPDGSKNPNAQVNIFGATY